MKQQNVELLQTLYEEYQGALRYTATRIGVNSDDVDDVIQDSFCAFIKAYGDTIDQWEIARQKGAIMRILKNRCVDYFRIKSRRGVSISLDEGYYGKEVPLPESLIGKDVLDQMAEDDEVNYIISICRILNQNGVMWQFFILLKNARSRKSVRFWGLKKHPAE